MKYSYLPDSYVAHAAYDPFAVVHEPFPAPVRTSRDPLSEILPSAPLSLAEFAREWSWEVHMQSSEGRMPHSTTGRPGALKRLVGLRFGLHPITDRRAYAVYSVTAGVWGSVMIWGPDLPPYAGCGVTELKHFLATPDMSAHDLHGWVAQIKARRAAQAAASKARPVAAPKAREGMS